MTQYGIHDNADVTLPVLVTLLGVVKTLQWLKDYPLPRIKTIK